MDNKVKITLATTGVLLLIIIVAGLYSSCNSADSTIKDTSKNNLQQAGVNKTRGGLGSKARTNVRTNEYYFPSDKEKRARIDPNAIIDEGDSKADDFFKSDNEAISDMIEDSGPDYVGDPEQEVEDTNDLMEKEMLKMSEI